MKIAIYKIWKEGKDECYIGSTKNFKIRMKIHKSACYNEKSKAYQFFIYQYIRQNGGWDEFCKEIIYECDVKDNTEKRMVEKEYIKKYESKLNMVDSYLSEEEKKEKDKQHKKNWYEKNKIKVKCPHCNIELSKASLSRHINHYCKATNN